MQLPSSNYSVLNKLVTWIRKGKAGDIPSIYRIESKSFKYPYTPVLLLNLLALYPNGYFVAENELEIVGYLIVRKVGQKGHIINLAVDEKYRYRKVGSLLLNKAIDVFRNWGLNGVWLEVRNSNLGAQRFYQKRGFENLKKVVGYYGDGEDALILYLPLSS
jgi:ribosomal-protein-alanine N-acetyltransferase